MCSVGDGNMAATQSKYLELSQPLFTGISLALRKGELYKRFVAVLGGGECDRVLPHVAEIISGIRVFARSQTLWSCHHSNLVSEGGGRTL